MISNKYHVKINIGIFRLGIRGPGCFRGFRSLPRNKKTSTWSEFGKPITTKIPCPEKLNFSHEEVIKKFYFFDIRIQHTLKAKG